jgi:LCP family protein required for cell wall assembly
MGARSSPSRASVWTKRILITLLVLANLGVFGAYLYLQRLERVFEDSVAINEDVVDELSDSPDSASEPSTFLIIGSDSRANLPSDFEGSFGNFGGARADVIMLLQVIPREDRAQLISIPRDFRVEVEGHGTQKVNAAYAYGGASLLVSTLRRATGLPIHHYVEVDFVGFAAIVDEVGGVSLNFPYPARDRKSGFHVEAGRQLLGGEMALAYARSRSYQELRNGTWVSVDANDIGRTHRQQQLVFGILSRMKRPSTLTQADDIVRSFGAYLEVDAALIDRGVVDLGWELRGLRAENIEAATLPTTTQIIGGIYYEVPTEPEATSMLQAFASGTPLTGSTVASGPLHLQVLNGNGTAGSASTWADVLEDQGFVIEQVGDASSFDFDVTQVVASPADLGRAQEVLEALGFGEAVPGAVPDGVDVVVILGSDSI